ncbi:MAG: hypothetical protein ACTSUU_07970, partial [Candidatus Thorarchaeota archaeon]
MKRLFPAISVFTLIILFFSITLSTASPQKEPRITIEPSSPLVNKTLLITIQGASEGLLLTLTTPTTQLTYLGNLTSRIPFTPNEEGAYKATLLNQERKESVASIVFNVSKETDRGLRREREERGGGGKEAVVSGGKREAPRNESLLILNPSPSTGIKAGRALTIIVSKNIPNQRLFITTPDETLRYSGQPRGRIGYVFPKPGKYVVQLRTLNGSVTEEYRYVVVAGERADFPANGSQSQSHGALLVAPQGRAVEAKILRGKGKVRIYPLHGPVTEILLDEKDQRTIGYDLPPLSNFSLGDKKVVSAFAIDPHNSTLNVTFTAIGTELYKCASWNFSSRTCDATWQKIMNLTPGVAYTLTLNSTDPGYIQTGLSTINTRKSSYEPNETVELLMVVLNSDGYVVRNASLNLTVTTPSNQTSSYTTNGDAMEAPAGRIREDEEGIYHLNYSTTREEGVYRVSLSDNDSERILNMTSFFLVNGTSNFTIIRNMPVVINPWLGPFNATVTIQPRVNTNNYSFTEVIPNNFTLLSSQGAKVTNDATNTYLTWENLSGNATLSYALQGPLVSPSLGILGPGIISSEESDVYREAKPWYIAVDAPGSWTDSGLSCTPNPVDNGSTINCTITYTCGGGDCSRGPAGFYLLDDSTRIDDTACADVDFKCGGVTIGGTCTGSSANNATCRASYTSCAAGTTIIATYHYTACSGVEAPPSNNTITAQHEDDGGSSNAATLDESYVEQINAVPTAPTVTLTNPPPNYVNDTTDVATLSFNCSASDDGTLDTILFYITNSTNQSFAENGSCTASGSQTTCTFQRTLFSGNYTWNCWANDTEGNGAFAINNRTVIINGSTTPTVKLQAPPDNSIDGDGSVYFECNASDATDIVNVTLYTNHTGNWQPRSTQNFTANNNTFVTANFTINNISDGTLFVWNCLATDDNGVSGDALANFTVNVTYLSEEPTVSLDAPGNDTTENLEPVTFNCSATDNHDIASLNLYTNKSGDFKFESTKQFTGSSDSDVQASFQLSGFTDAQTIIWNCKAIDNDSNEVFYESNYTLHVDFLQPNVTLYSPSDYSSDLDGNVNLTCNATDNSDIVNITLYDDRNGSWSPVQTINFTGSADTSVNATFQVTGIPYGSEFQWNCLATDEDGFTAWAPANYTLTIPPVGTNYFAPDGMSGGTWPNPNRADEEADGQTANANLDDQQNLYTFNYTGLPTKGTLLEAYLSFRWSVSKAPTNDYLGIQYSPDGGVNYYSLTGTLNAYTQPSSYPLSQTNQSYLVTGSLNLSQLPSLRFRVTGFKVQARDYVNTLIDAIWLTARISPPPYPTGYGKNQSIVFENESIDFWSYWVDDTSLDCYIFSINQTGAWENSTCLQLEGKEENATISWLINASPGTTVQWRFYARDNYGDENATPVQSFVVSDANDAEAPVIQNLSASPASAQALTIFNLSADITDNIGVVSANVEVTTPSGNETSYSMTQDAGNAWWATVVGLEGGTYTFKVYAQDGNGNSNVSATNGTFNVSALVQTDKAYYDRGETVLIEGYGFSAGTTVTFDVKNGSGASQTGFPTNEPANSDGNSSAMWSIPSGLTFALGNYSVLGSDTNDSTGLADNTSLLVVLKPDAATKTDDVSSGDSVKSLVNESDNNRSMIIGDTAEAYIELRFQDQLLAGYTLDSLLLHVEHRDLDPESDTIDIQYYDGAAWQAASCGSLTYRSTEAIDACNLTADIPSLPDENDIRIRLSDGNDGNDGINFADIDFAYLDIDFSITNTLSVTIDAPNNIKGTYDYTETSSNKAYDGEATAEPPATQITGSEASSSEYKALETPDNDRWQTIATTEGVNAYQSFYFLISENEADVVQFTITHEGYATRKTSLTADPYRIYLWNYDTSAYDLVSADPITASGSDKTTTIEVKGGLDSYIDTNGEVNILVIGDYTLAGGGNPANLRADIFTDYLALTVERISTITGFQDINVTAIDGDGVQSCSYTFVQGAVRYTEYEMQNVNEILWYNVSDTSVYSDGVYNITANCTDGTEVNDTEYVTVRVVNQAPSVNLVSPGENANFTVSSINFTWNASSSSANPLCDLFIDGSENLSDVVSPSGENTTRQVSGFTDGDHSWYVRCNVGGGAYNTTETRNFTVDTAGPTVSLNAPPPDNVINQTTILFNYTPTDTSTISNCSLYVDGSYNQSNATSIENGVPNNFSVSLTEGSHNWSVECTDEFGWNTLSETRNLTIDTTKPWITLAVPTPGETFLGGLVQFNYTAYDNEDASLTCNITIDGIVEDPNIPSPNGTPVIRNLEVGDGFKVWNVTCVDNARNTNVSETRNFTVQGPPTVNLLYPSAGEWLNETAVNFTYFAEDGDGIQNCSLYLDGNYNRTDGNVTNSSNNNFSVTLPEGSHNWTVKCYDGINKWTMPDYSNFTVDTTPPNITLYAPPEDSNESDHNVTFYFNVTDNLDTNLRCNITLNGVVSDQNKNFEAVNGSNTSRVQTGVASGDNYWSVTCVDDAGWSYTSETRYFFMGGIPDVQLNSPPNGSQRGANVTFIYTPTDELGIQNCSLYINGLFNQTNATPVENGSQNNFTVDFTTEQNLTWYVNCTNGDGLTGVSETRVLYIDLTDPTVNLTYPDSDIISNSSVVFNFTAYDNNASWLLCDLYLNGTLNESGINATESVAKIVQVDDFTEGLWYWNMTCTDEAGNSAWSSTNNFTIAFGPSVSLQYPRDQNVTSDTDVLFNYTVSSTAPLKNCSLLFNGSANQTKNASEIPHIGDGEPNNFTVVSISEGIYNWSVQCYDTNNNPSLIDETRILHVDRAAPNVTLNSPDPAQNLSLSTITFNFTAYDNVDDALVCNLTIYSGGTLNKSSLNISAQNSVPVTVPISNFTSGAYKWNVTCSDGLYTNTSETRNFTVSNTPKVTLLFPGEGYSDADGYLEFSYRPETIAVGGWQYCQFIVDGAVNDSNVTIDNGEVNYFYLNLTSSGNHTWQVNCTDQDWLNASDGPLNFSVDFEDPIVSANEPRGATLNSTVTFNFTATDNLDTNLTCELYTNGSLNATTWAVNGTPRLFNVSGFTDGFFLWNVTCYDDANRSTSSTTENFTVAEIPTIELGDPVDDYRNSTVNLILYYTPRDNSGTLANCSLILNGGINQSNATPVQEG